MACSTHSVDQHIQWQLEGWEDEERQREHEERTATIVREVLKRELGTGGRRADPILIDVAEAARLLGIKPDALRQRVSRRQVPGVVRTGRRLQFHRPKLLEGVEKKAVRR